MASPKHTHYRYKLSGEVFAALKHPAGYEDAHPEDWEPVDLAQEAAAAAANAAPPAPPSIPAIPNIPPNAPPQLPPNTAPTVVSGAMDDGHERNADNTH